MGICKKKVDGRTFEHIFYFTRNKNLKIMLFFLRTDFRCPMLFRKNEGIKIKDEIDDYLTSINGIDSEKLEGYSENFFLQDKSIGFIYLLRSGNFTKVGATINLKARMHALTAILLEDFELIFSSKVRNPFQIEQILHEKLREKRVRGEWFRLSQDDIEFIKDFIKSNNCEYPVHNLSQCA